MSDLRVERLTERQREVLRLIRPGFTTDMVVAEIGGSKETIETHIKRARAVLGGVSRFEAAEILARAEGRSPHSEGTHRLGIAEMPDAVAPPGSQSQYSEEEEDRTRVSFVNESAWPMHHAGHTPIQPPFAWRGRTIGSMSKVQRFAWTVALVCLIVIAVGVFVTAADGLRNIVWSYRSQQ